jgi:hypothetical protein
MRRHVRSQVDDNPRCRSTRRVSPSGLGSTYRIRRPRRKSRVVPNTSSKFRSSIGEPRIARFMKFGGQLEVRSIPAERCLRSSRSRSRIGVGVKLFARNSIQFSQPSWLVRAAAQFPCHCARVSVQQPYPGAERVPVILWQHREIPLDWGLNVRYLIAPPRALGLKSIRPLMIWLSRSAPIVGFDVSICPASWPLNAQ